MVSIAMPMQGTMAASRSEFAARWSHIEDAYILAQRARSFDWQSLASALPGRTADSVRNRWHRLNKDLKEQQCVWPAAHSYFDYSYMLGRHVPSIAACIPGCPVLHESRERVLWSESEDQLILQGVAEHGKAWRKIAKSLSTKADGKPRTDSAVRNRYMRLVELRLKPVEAMQPTHTSDRASERHNEGAPYRISERERSWIDRDSGIDELEALPGRRHSASCEYRLSSAFSGSE